MILRSGVKCLDQQEFHWRPGPEAVFIFRARVPARVCVRVCVCVSSWDEVVEAGFYYPDMCVRE